MSGEAYDPVANPYAPGAGTPPPAMVGRDPVVADARTSLRRLRAGRSTQHLLLTGLRGVGKTVLLATLAALGEGEGFRVIRHEAVGGEDTVASVLRQARRIVDELGPGPRVARAVRSIESVSVTLLGAGASVGRNVTPDREALADVVVDVVAAAADHDRAALRIMPVPPEAPAPADADHPYAQLCICHRTSASPCHEASRRATTARPAAPDRLSTLGQRLARPGARDAGRGVLYLSKPSSVTGCSA